MNRSDAVWRAAPSTAVFPRVDEVVVWRVALDSVAIDLAELSTEERQRADRLKFPDVRQAFIQGRLFLRRAIARTLERDPASLTFAAEGNGKPFLSGRPLSFNLSHSGGLAALAVASAGPVGIDVEFVRSERDLLGLAKRYFAPSESAALLRLPSAEQAAGFYRCWTRKEAFIKAIGEGLSHPLDGFEVSLEPQAPAKFLSFGGKPADESPWRLFNLELGGAFAGAVVTQRAVDRMTCFTLETI